MTGWIHSLALEFLNFIFYVKHGVLQRLDSAEEVAAEIRIRRIIGTSLT